MTQQLDEPYTRITHEILEEIAKRRFNGTQYGIIIAVLRNTYGFQRKSHRLSISFLAEATLCNKTQIKRELDKLISMKVIKVYDEGNRVISREIGFNKYFTEWDLEYTRNRVYANQSTPELEYTEYANQSTHGVRELEYQERNIFKENLKESTTTENPLMILMDEYCNLHQKLDVYLSAKERSAMKELVETQIPLQFILETMNKIHKQKTESGENVTSFFYYPNTIKDAWKRQNTIISLPASKYQSKSDRELDELEKYREELKRGQASGH